LIHHGRKVVDAKLQYELIIQVYSFFIFKISCTANMARTKQTSRANMRSAPTAANSTGGNQVGLKGGRKRSAEEQAQDPSGSIGTSGRKRPSRKKSKDTSVSLEGSTPWTAQINKEKARDKHDSEDEEKEEEEDTVEKEEEEDTDEKEEEEDTDCKDDEEEEEDDDKKEDTEEEDNNYDPRDGGDDYIDDEILDEQVSRLKEKIHKHNAEEAATSASAAKAAMAGKRKQPPTGGTTTPNRRKKPVGETADAATCTPDRGRKTRSFQNEGNDDASPAASTRSRISSTSPSSPKTSPKKKPSSSSPTKKRTPPKKNVNEPTSPPVASTARKNPSSSQPSDSGSSSDDSTGDEGEKKTTSKDPNFLISTQDEIGKKESDEFLDGQFGSFVEEKEKLFFVDTIHNLKLT
jgi:hypothetical protein